MFERWRSGLLNRLCGWPHARAIRRTGPLPPTPAQTPKALAQPAANDRHPEVTSGTNGRCWARTNDLRLVETVWQGPGRHERAETAVDTANLFGSAR